MKAIYRSTFVTVKPSATSAKCDEIPQRNTVEFKSIGHTLRYPNEVLNSLTAGIRGTFGLAKN
jgi:hypothetical protein